MRKTTLILLTIFSALAVAGVSCPMPDHSGCPDDCPGSVAIKAAVDSCMKESKGKRSLESCQAEAKASVSKH